MSIQVSRLTKIYDHQVAVNAISFEIPDGQVVGFLGPNGAGKSTTMKILTGFISATSGTASVCGYDVSNQSKEARGAIGYLPEHNPLYLEMYVREYLRFMGELSGIGKQIRERVEEMIERTGLTRESKKKIAALSKGYRQRVGLAQALLHNPQVLILDEPTSGLDPNQVIEIRNIIREIGKDRTVMLSTHIMQEVEAMCDRVIIINKGNIVADDTVTNLRRQNSESRLTVRFKKPVSVQKLKAIKGITSVEEVGASTYKLSCSDPEGIQEALFNFAVSESNIILKQKEDELSLENVFRQYTR
ncbi:MAG: gliding motility-associated ABC transporter ATP-binding subunit GldA [Bacteroidetes bacterium]|nr:gliding motility-associated ABC transporter ATP-binding subunit GldA [Bacteroidota bacterium]